MQRSNYTATRAKSAVKRQKVFYQEASITPTKTSQFNPNYESGKSEVKTKADQRDTSKTDSLKVLIPNELSLCI